MIPFFSTSIIVREPKKLKSNGEFFPSVGRLTNLPNTFILFSTRPLGLKKLVLIESR